MSARAAHWLRWFLRPAIAIVMIPLGVAIGVGGLLERLFGRGRAGR